MPKGPIAKKTNRTKKKTSELRHILLVEDERPMAETLFLKLTHEGFRVTTAVHGNEALTFMKSTPFDLILLDLIMPYMDGFEVLSEMQNKYTTPVIILTNLSQEEDRERTRKLGAKGYLVKSDVQLKDIVTHVKKLLS